MSLPQKVARMGKHTNQYALPCHRTQSVRSGSDNRHIAAQDVDQLRQLSNAGPADESADLGDPVIIAAG